MSLPASPHLRAIVIAGALAAVALALGFVTLGMNQAGSAAAPHTVLSLKQRRLAGAHGAKPVVAKKVAHKAPNRDLVAALRLGLPRMVAQGLAASRVTVVSLTSAGDSVAAQSLDEARAGAKAADASFEPINVDGNNALMSQLTAALGGLPVAPATIVFVRPGKVFVKLAGFNDRTVVEQAARSALSSRGS